MANTLMDFLANNSLVLAEYVVLGGAYLLVIPVLIYLYLSKRWYTASSWERVLMYFLVFFFFPGLLALAPFLNFRPQKRQIVQG
ncbi:MAG: NAD(P)H-quinone oxidoreductase subunit L [Leptolyngbyaceae cyanobacterium bins.59]|nr:NAD(P)H-quinone oxidoreductase subunit L [Leptolyngbyaceae cyanobacterium bins.59]